MILKEAGSGADGRYFFVFKDGSVHHISEVATKRGERCYEYEADGDLLMVTFRRWAVDIRRLSQKHGEKVSIKELKDLEFSLSEREQKSFEELREFERMVDQVKSFSQHFHFGEEKMLREAFSRMDDLKLKMKLIPKRRKLLTQLKKGIYQLWFLQYLIDVIQGGETEIFVSRRFKGKQLDHPKRLYESYEEQYGAPPEKLTGLFGRKERLTLGPPTVVLDDPAYSIWEEFQTPTPEPGVPRLRPDFVVKKGQHQSLFDPKVLDYIRDYELDRTQLAPDFFNCLKPIDLLIECKTFRWREEHKEQMNRYKRLLSPKLALLVARREIPPPQKKKLDHMGIEHIENFDLSHVKGKRGALKEIISKV